MKRRILVESIIILVFAVAALAESIRLTLNKDPTKLYDPIGPAYYILFLSLLLLAASVAHFVSNLDKTRLSASVARGSTQQGARRQMVGMTVTLGLYLIAINVFGYLVSTIMFFLAEFRIVGIDSWLKCILHTIILTAVCYFVFIKYGGMVFPRGIFY